MRTTLLNRPVLVSTLCIGLIVSCAVVGFSSWSFAAPPDESNATSQPAKPSTKTNDGLERLRSEANRLRLQLNAVNRQINKLEIERRERPVLGDLL